MVLLLFISIPNKKSLSSSCDIHVIIVANLEGGRTVNWREWFDGLNWPMALFWSLCLFALLWGGQRLYQKNFVLRPCLEEVKGLEGVAEVKLKGKELYVKLDFTDSLKSTAEKLTRITGEFLGPDLTVYLVDTRNKELIGVWEEMSLSLAQAVTRGEFETMRPHWTAAAKRAGVDLQVAVDSSSLYLSLRKGDHYLYEILPRERQSPVQTEQKPQAVAVQMQVIGKEGQL